jgi:hypothetical protein
MYNPDEINVTPVPDSTWVETSFGRSDFHQVEDVATKRRYSDRSSAKALGVNPSDVRRWAADRGITVGKRGRIAAHIVRDFKDTH